MAERAGSGWRALALSTSAGLLISLCYAGRAPREELGREPSAEQAVPHVGASARGEPSGQRADRGLLARFMQRLERKQAAATRCAVLQQLAASPTAGDGALAVLEQYARPGGLHAERACALSALGATANSAAVGSLLQLGSVVERALHADWGRALAVRAEPGARAALVAAARDRSSALRSAAVVALAEVGASEAVPLIGELLEEPDSSARRLIQALGASGDPRALPILQDLLTRTDGLFTNEIITALGELSRPEATNRLLELARTAPWRKALVYRALSRSSDPGAERALLSAAGSDATALQAILELDTPDVRAFMLRALDGSDQRRVTTAAMYFGQHADARAGASLARLAQGTGVGVEPALQALAAMGGEAAREALENVAGRTGPLQNFALQALAQQPDAEERARALALSLLEGPEDAPSAALTILARDPSAEARSALLSAAQRGDTHGTRAIWLLARRDDPQTLETLSAIARDARSPHRLQALSALSEGGSEQGADVLRGALRDADPRLRAEAVGMLGRLEGAEHAQAALHASRDPDPDVAAAAALQLSDVGTPEAVDRLTQLATAQRDNVGEQALQSLAHAAPERAAEVVDTLLRGDEAGLRVALTAVARLPPDAGQRVLSQALATGNSDVITEALHQLPNSEVAPSLLADALDRIARDGRLPGELRAQAHELLLTEAEGEADADITQP